MCVNLVYEFGAFDWSRSMHTASWTAYIAELARDLLMLLLARPFAVCVKTFSGSSFSVEDFQFLSISLSVVRETLQQRCWSGTTYGHRTTVCAIRYDRSRRFVGRITRPKNTMDWHTYEVVNNILRYYTIQCDPPIGKLSLHPN